MSTENEIGMFGRDRIIKTCEPLTPLLEISKIRSLLRLNQHTISDSNITHFMTVALEWVEQQLGKTLLPTIRESVRYNTRFVLPYGPVESLDNIEKVIYNKKELKKEEYNVRMHKDSLEISIPCNPFSNRTRTLIVQYKAGYSTHVPQPYKNAILNTIEYLVNNNGNIEALKSATAPWIDPFREYSIL